MSIYTGSGYRCQVSAACAFRVFPASGSDEHLDEAARVRRAHEAGCHFRGALPSVPSHSNMDDRRTALSSTRIALEVAPRAAGAAVKYNREPTGVGWYVAIQQFVREHPEASVRQVARELGCRETTASTYLGMARKATA